MDIIKTFHVRNKVVRDMAFAVLMVILGVATMPAHYIVSDDQFQGLFAGLLLGFGMGYLVRSLIAAKDEGCLRNNQIICDEENGNVSK